MRIKDMITDGESYWYLNIFSPLLLEETFQEIMRIWILMLGIKGLNQTLTYFLYKLKHPLTIKKGKPVNINKAATSRSKDYIVHFYWPHTHNLKQQLPKGEIGKIKTNWLNMITIITYM